MKGLLLLLLIIASGCLSPVKELYPEDENERPVTVYIVSHGWHAGIAIEASAIEEYLPSHPDMPSARYLKFGWGDGRYYTDSEAGFWLMMRAALLPTRSVIHVVGIDIPVERYFSGSKIIQIKVSEEGAKKMGEFVENRFRRDENDEVVLEADGLYTNSAFFQATGRYYLPKTSNIWTARALRQTGYPITPIYSFTSGNVVQQAKRDGVEIQ
ncbi:MAG: DUF2459 domain-containing protein [Balneolaceae bacterium]|nr:MAG: DUF2459 domain-containing protein [Balneolaceae bacterium]